MISNVLVENRQLFNCWYEVDLGMSAVVSGVITQGGLYYYRVTRYKVSYKKLPSLDFEDILDRKGGFGKVFEGNIEDSRFPITNMFEECIVATIVRVVPVAYKHGVALRLELLGCYNEVE
ncbi:lactadherin-like [Asterias amurensis]|uniref:lactadherin-like n=1 Tax=Asterias amurensis TaxID=7602 RepID=UPI003AB8E6A1